uniref:G-protein coupled receptors family 1 profile domain-containing protein n=1 Tax=Latimeria chalumnae TaxID=7897 RepID=H3BGW5_LATCH
QPLISGELGCKMDGLMECLLGNASNNSDAGRPEKLPRAQLYRVLVPVLDAAIFVIGVVGHTLVTIILLKRRQRRNGTTTLLINLSVANLLQLACLPFDSAAIALGEWVFGSFLCKFLSFADTACSSASVFTLAALSINRYLSIVHPTKAYRFHGSWYSRLVIGTIWLPALGLATPQLVYRILWSEPAHCFALLPDTGETLYSISLFVAGFVLPLVVIIAMYAGIMRYLWVKRKAMKTRYLDKYNARVMFVSITLVLAFTVCWLPSYVLLFLLISRLATLRGVFPIFARGLASSSSCVNPFIYAFLSKQFRNDLYAVLTRSCGKRDGNRVEPTGPGTDR